jgi:hypothetical protein
VVTIDAAVPGRRHGPVPRVEVPELGRGSPAVACGARPWRSAPSRGRSSVEARQRSPAVAGRRLRSLGIVEARLSWFRGAGARSRLARGALRCPAVAGGALRTRSARSRGSRCRRSVEARPRSPAALHNKSINSTSFCATHESAQKSNIPYPISTGYGLHRNISTGATCPLHNTAIERLYPSTSSGGVGAFLFIAMGKPNGSLPSPT